MSRGNIVLTAVLAAAVGIWFMTRDSDSDKPSGPAPRLFPDFNKEAVDSIVIEGGWEKTRWVFSRLGSQWTLSSAGGYPVIAETVNGFIDAVYHLRKDALVGSSAELRKSSRTGEQGRLVRVFQGNTPMAEFRVGKTPEDSTQTFFVRREDGKEVYRTRTLLTKELDKAPSAPASPWDTGPSGYRWSDYTKQASYWMDTQIWRLGSAETQKVKLTREGKYEVELTRKSEEEWELQEVGKPEKLPADVDAASGIYDDLRYLNFVDVLGKHEDVYEEYGLDKPEIILILTLKKKIEKPKEPKPKEKEEPKDDEKKDDKKKKKDEYRVFKRFLEVGKKITRPSSYDDETGKAKEDTYYVVHIGGEFDEDEKEMEERSKYVFLVDAVNLRGLRKELDELKQKPAEDEDDGKDDADKKKEEPKKAESEKDKAKKDAPKEKPKEPKKDDAATDPKQDEPGESKKAEPKDPKDKPEKPKKGEPKDPKKDDK